MPITLIACLDMNNGIADHNGNLLFNLPRDMQHFKSVTGGKIVIMGRKTWDSLPKKPLQKRKNYILTKDEKFSPNGAKVINSIDEALALGEKHDVYVMGGGEVYSQLIEHADRLVLTHVHAIHEGADVFFPDFSPDNWKIQGKPFKNEADENNPHSFTFATYKRHRENT